MNRAPTSLAVCVALLCGALCAQRTFIVDANNGPNTSFLDLPPALAQAQHGDVYLIRAATYSSVNTTDKGVSLIALGNVSFPLGSTSSFGLTVANLPAGRSFQLSGITFVGSLGNGIDLKNNAGRVHLEDVSMALTSLQGIGLRADLCRAITVSSCTFGGASINVTNSTVVLIRSSAVGRMAYLGIDGGAALFTDNSDVEVIGGSYIGGPGFSLSGRMGLPGPGIRCSGPLSVLLGVSQGLVVAAGSGPVAGPALDLRGARAVSDPAVQLQPNGAAPPVFLISGATFVTRPVPALVAGPTKTGGNTTLTLTSPAGDPYFLVAAPPADPSPLYASILMLDLSAHAVLAVGTQAPTGQVQHLLPVPANPWLVGFMIGFQSASYGPATGLLSLTNPALRLLQ